MSNALTIHKFIYGYAYPRNGNVHNPTPKVSWIVRDSEGRIIDQDRRLRVLKQDYPGAKVVTDSDANAE